jgi:hypothetical protein
VVEYVESVIGEQVDRGECWDLAYQALTRIDAKWDGKYKYGREINPKRREVFPGDIIQFKNVKSVTVKGIQYTPKLWSITPPLSIVS